MWSWTDEDRAEGSKRRKTYEICKERGHQPSGMMLSSNPPWETCKRCGTAYRWERVLHELDYPDKKPRS